MENKDDKEFDDDPVIRELREHIRKEQEYQMQLLERLARVQRELAEKERLQALNDPNEKEKRKARFKAMHQKNVEKCEQLMQTARSEDVSEETRRRARLELHEFMQGCPKPTSILPRCRTAEQVLEACDKAVDDMAEAYAHVVSFIPDESEPKESENVQMQNAAPKRRKRGRRNAKGRQPWANSEPFVLPEQAKEWKITVEVTKTQPQGENDFTIVDEFGRPLNQKVPEMTQEEEEKLPRLLQCDDKCIRFGQPLRSVDSEENQCQLRLAKTVAFSFQVGEDEQPTLDLDTPDELFGGQAENAQQQEDRASPSGQNENRFLLQDVFEAAPPQENVEEIRRQRSEAVSDFLVASVMQPQEKQSEEKLDQE